MSVVEALWQQLLCILCDIIQQIYLYVKSYKKVKTIVIR